VTRRILSLHDAKKPVTFSTYAANQPGVFIKIKLVDESSPTVVTEKSTGKQLTYITIHMKNW